MTTPLNFLLYRKMIRRLDRKQTILREVPGQKVVTAGATNWDTKDIHYICIKEMLAQHILIPSTTLWHNQFLHHHRAHLLFLSQGPVNTWARNPVITFN